MTTMPAGRMPVFTLAWRLRLALETADMSVQEMAEALGYSRSTISRWLNEQDEPRAAVKAQWALLTGVDREWLENGNSAPTPPDGGRRGARDDDALARLTAKKRARGSGHVSGTYVQAA